MVMEVVVVDAGKPAKELTEVGWLAKETELPLVGQ
jgi:hypothetical protein